LFSQTFYGLPFSYLTITDVTSYVDHTVHLTKSLLQTVLQMLLSQKNNSCTLCVPMFSVVFTYFQLRFWYVLKQRKPGILWVPCPLSHESGWLPLICHVILTKHTSAGALIHRQQTICWISAQKKLSSIYSVYAVYFLCNKKYRSPCLFKRKGAFISLSSLLWGVVGGVGVGSFSRREKIKK